MKYETITISVDDEILIPIPQNLKDCITLIKSDYFRYHGKHGNLLKIFLYTFRNHVFKCIDCAKQGVCFIRCLG